MVKLTLPQTGQTINAPLGANLYSILTAEGLIEGPCGGKGICKKCQVTMDGVPVLSCLYTVEKDVTVLLPQENEVGEIISTGYMKQFAPDSDGPSVFGVAVDIGTTTVVASLFDLARGEEVLSLACLNGQKRYGQDVISRIQYTVEHEMGTLQLQQKIVEDLQSLVSQLTERHGISQTQVTRMVIAGNPTMIYLLAGYSTASLASAPYCLSFTGPLTLSAGALGLDVCRESGLYCLPAISAFVGGDITAGLVACGIEKEGPYTLFIDIGTNGELVLSGGGTQCCCSCAAGPALEGMNITCGMRAAKGAIEDVTIQAGCVQCRVIGGGTASGLCGSGLLTAVAALRAAGVIEQSGRFADHPLVQKIDEMKCVMLDAAQSIYLSQKDVRQVQLAKGAILSGVLTLLAAANCAEAAVERVIVAGQFGTHLTAESLVGSGLLPAAWANRITYAGNTAKSGAAVCLLSSAERARCDELVRNIDYIELSLCKGYEALFVECLSF